MVLGNTTTVSICLILFTIKFIDLRFYAKAFSDIINLNKILNNSQLCGKIFLLDVSIEYLCYKGIHCRFAREILC